MKLSSGIGCVVEEYVQAGMILFEIGGYEAQRIARVLDPRDAQIAFRFQVKAQIPMGLDLRLSEHLSYRNSFARLTWARDTLTAHVTRHGDRGAQVSAHAVWRKCSVTRPDPSAWSSRTHAASTTMRFGEFLLSQGVIDEQELENALRLQRKRRPLIGQIAMSWGIISPKEFAQVLHLSLSTGRSFGDIAVERGSLADIQIRQILRAQAQYNCPIGIFFVQAGLLSWERLEQLGKRHRALQR